MAGGGDPTGAAGIVRTIMTTAGSITEGSLDSTMTWTPIGEDTTIATTGRATDGTISQSPIRSFNGTGKPGRVTDIGKSRKNGTFRIIRPSPSSSGSKCGKKDNASTSRGPRFSSIKNR